MELTDKIEFEPSVTDCFAPDLLSGSTLEDKCNRMERVLIHTYIDQTSSMSGKQQFSLEPFVVSSLVKRGREDAIICSFTDRLFEQDRPVEGEEADTVTATNHDVASHVIDPRTLYPRSESGIAVFLS